MTADIRLEENGAKTYSEHPSDYVDVAAVTLNADFFTENDLEVAYFDIDRHAMDTSEFLEKGGNAGSFIYMLGYPMGLVDVDSNVPVCRLGCVARVEEHEVARTKCVLIDVQNFPGNSGSPIITKPELVSITGTPAISESVLIGIVHSYIPYEEKLINSQTSRVVEIKSENSGIAKCNPVEYIRETIDLEMERISNASRAVTPVDDND